MTSILETDNTETVTCEHVTLSKSKWSYSKWLLREFFGRKVTFFLIYISKDPHDSCDHFHIKISVVGARCVGGKGKKLIKKSNKLHLTRDVIDDVTLMSHTSYKSPWSKVCYSEVSKSGDHVVVLYSNQKKNRKMALKRHQSNKCQLTRNVIDDVTHMNHTSYESPWSEVCYSEVSKSGNHVVAL